MKPFNMKLGMMAVGLALTAMPVLAGQRPSEGTSPGADRAVDRGSNAAGGGSASAGGGGGNVAGGGGSAASSSPSSDGAASPSVSGADRSSPMAAEPQHRRPSGGGGGGSSSGGGDRAVPRGSGSSGSSGNSGTTRSGGGSTTSSSAGSNNSSEPNHDRAVPSWSRPRGDQPSTGTAVDRTTPPHRGDGVIIGGGYYYPYFPYGFGYPGYGLGLGFGFYDPWYDPMYGGYGYGGYSGYGGYGSGYGTGSGYDPYTYGAQDSRYSSREEGSVRLKVKPRDAKVYVDGFFVGVVDSFDGAFQKLTLPGGPHRVEVKADGYEPAQFDVLITPGQTLTYQGELKRIH